MGCGEVKWGTGAGLEKREGWGGGEGTESPPQYCISSKFKGGRNKI